MKHGSFGSADVLIQVGCWPTRYVVSCSTCVAGCIRLPRMHFHISRSNDVRFKAMSIKNIQSRFCS